MQTLLTQVNALVSQTWFWVLVALVTMYFLNCHARRRLERFDGGSGVNPTQGTAYRSQEQAGHVVRSLRDDK